MKFSVRLRRSVTQRRITPLLVSGLLAASAQSAGANPPASQPVATQPAITPFTQPIEETHTKPYAGLDISYMRFDKPRPLRTWIARIDLRAPGVELQATCGADVGPEWETRCETTLEFAARRDVQFAINASAFEPFRGKTGEPMQVVGLGACDGTVYSPPDERFGAFILTKDNRIIIADPPYDLDNIEEAVAGFDMLVADGQDIAHRSVAKRPKGFVNVNPRTAAGVDKTGNTLFLAVFDGRQKGGSEGITLPELARFFLDLGAYQAINLDGGGSTTMVLHDPATGEHKILNAPSGRDKAGNIKLRRVANNLGVRFSASANSGSKKE
jgi:hypothetical protein